MNNSAESTRNSRAIQSRINGAKSKGPTSISGKTRSSQNATRHGLYSSRIVLDNEPQAEYDALLDQLLERFQTTDPLALQLIHDLAATRWRINRCHRMEAAMFNGTQETNEEDFNRRSEGEKGDIETHRTTEAWRDLVNDSPYLHLTHQEARLHRQFMRTFNALLKLEKSNLLTSPTPVGRAMACAEARLRDKKAPTSELENHRNEPSDPNSNTQIDTNELPPDNTQNSQNEPKLASVTIEIDTNELPLAHKNIENEPEKLLKTQQRRILEYCNSEPFLKSFAPTLNLVRQGKLTYDEYLSEIRTSVARLLNIKNDENEPSDMLVPK